MYFLNIKKISSTGKEQNNRALIILFLSLIAISSIVFNGCVQAISEYEALPPGKWRAVLDLNIKAPIIREDQVERKISTYSMPGELPFNFEVFYTNKNDFYIEIINADERIKVEEIYFGRDPATAFDTIVIYFPEYDSYIKGIFKENVIEGNWYVNYRENYSVPFIAYHGQGHRFSDVNEAPIIDISGKWASIFKTELEAPFPAIGLFNQVGNKLTGTFRTETGDYRYLEGMVRDSQFSFSCFDGAHAFLFEGRLRGNTISGSFRSGKHYKAEWHASRNDSFEIGDEYELTYLLDGKGDFDFSFPDTENQIISLHDDRFKGKVKLVSVFGTWCPNCKDEMNFLVDYLNKNPNEDIEVIGIAFEKYRESNKAIDQLKRYKINMNIPFPLLLGGYFDKKEAGTTFPMLNHIMSYPTLFFLDRENKLRKIHTGFNSPATDRYESFQEEFHLTLNELLQE